MKSQNASGHTHRFFEYIEHMMLYKIQPNPTTDRFRHDFFALENGIRRQSARRTCMLEDDVMVRVRLYETTILTRICARLILLANWCVR